MFRRMAGAIALILLVACAAENQSGLPETETTGTAQSVQETSTASATTTGESGGTLSALTPDDKEFVDQGRDGRTVRGAAGNLALQKASNPAVRAFAQRVVTDHSKANAELAQLARQGRGAGDELSGEHKAAVEHLASLNGAEFDKAYMQHMVSDHEERRQRIRKGLGLDNGRGAEGLGDQDAADATRSRETRE